MANFGGCAEGKNRPLSAPLERTRSMSGKREFSARLSSHRIYYVRQNTFYADYCKYRIQWTRDPDRFELEVPIPVATSHDTARPGRHKADNDFSASW